uniref:Uncharacterized protein n=1 Tax=Eutreptiella gymnastica TaxID=73025 RepID=A0A7S4CYY6_9EUGL
MVQVHARACVWHALHGDGVWGIFPAVSPSPGPTAQQLNSDGPKFTWSKARACAHAQPPFSNPRHSTKNRVPTNEVLVWARSGRYGEGQAWLGSFFSKSRSQRSIQHRLTDTRLDRRVRILTIQPFS